jgi:hypothetical protein
MLTEPKGIDPAAWAHWNEQAARILSKRMGIETPELEIELAPYAVEIVELPPAITDLTLAVRRAASELEGTSEKADRIALQLLTALAHFAKDTGT